MSLKKFNNYYNTFFIYKEDVKTYILDNLNSIIKNYLLHCFCDINIFINYKSGEFSIIETINLLI